MSGHEQFAEDLALYALSALSGEERASLEQHLATCAACNRELEQLRGDGALLALSTMGPRPPHRARRRLLEAVEREGATFPASSEVEPRHALRSDRDKNYDTDRGKVQSWRGWLGWATAAAVIVLAVLAASLWTKNSDLRNDLTKAQLLLNQRALDLEQAQSIANALTNPDGQHFTLVAAKTPLQPQGKAIYLPNRSSLIFLANNMPSLPAQKAYELWLIPAQGAPIPAGVFKPDAHGSATVINPPLPPGTVAKAFAITVENESGAATPTMPIVMIGAAGE